MQFSDSHYESNNNDNSNDANDSCMPSDNNNNNNSDSKVKSNRNCKSDNNNINYNDDPMTTLIVTHDEIVINITLPWVLFSHFILNALCILITQFNVKIVQSQLKIRL